MINKDISDAIKSAMMNLRNPESINSSSDKKKTTPKWNKALTEDFNILFEKDTKNIPINADYHSSLTPEISDSLMTDFFRHVIPAIFPCIGEFTLDVNKGKIKLSKTGFDDIAINSDNMTHEFSDVSVMLILLINDIRNKWE